MIPEPGTFMYDTASTIYIQKIVWFTVNPCCWLAFSENVFGAFAGRTKSGTFVDSFVDVMVFLKDWGYGNVGGVRRWRGGTRGGWIGLLLELWEGKGNEVKRQEELCGLQEGYLACQSIKDISISRHLFIAPRGGDLCHFLTDMLKPVKQRSKTTHAPSNRPEEKPRVTCVRS